MGAASLIKEMLGQSISVTDSTHCINKAILYLGDNDVNHINDVPNSPDKQNKICSNPILHRIFLRSLDFSIYLILPAAMWPWSQPSL
jgi:hypothetical protein